MKIKGTFLYYDVENSNGRMYTKECAKDIVKQFEELSHEIPMFGQLGYPNAENFKGNLSDASHKVKEIHINEERKSIEGTVEILNTPNGRKLLGLIDNDIEKFNELYVVRSRGTGEINENKEITNYNIISFDVVPKDTDAFIEMQKPLKLE